MNDINNLIEDTSGFYKLEGLHLLFGPNFVLNKDYELYKENHLQYTYPVDGWYWFDSEEEARIHLGLPPAPHDENEKD